MQTKLNRNILLVKSDGLAGSDKAAIKAFQESHGPASMVQAKMLLEALEAVNHDPQRASIGEQSQPAAQEKNR